MCQECQHHFRVSATQRIGQIVDPDSFEPFNEAMAPADPLNFVDLNRFLPRDPLPEVPRRALAFGNHFDEKFGLATRRRARPAIHG